MQPSKVKQYMDAVWNRPGVANPSRLSAWYLTGLGMVVDGEPPIRAKPGKTCSPKPARKSRTKKAK
jgi:hypothetical protein